MFDAVSSSSPQLVKAILDANPALMFVVDYDVRLIVANRSAVEFLGGNRDRILSRRGGEVFNCIHAAEECGQSLHCRSCVIRNSVNTAYKGSQVVRSRAVMELQQGEESSEFYALVTAAPFAFEGNNLVLLTIEDINELAELWKILPICSVCKKIRDDDQYWTEVEQYFRKHWDVRFTHGYCPECQKEVLEKRG